MTNETRTELMGVDADGDKYYFKEKGKTIKELREETIVAERKAMEYRETYEPEVSEEWELEQMRWREEAEAAAGTGYNQKGGK